MADALVFGPGARRAIPLVGRATSERAASAFAAIGQDARASELVSAPDVACELKLGVGPGWSDVWLARPSAALERHVLRPRTEVWGVRLVPGVLVGERALAAVRASRAHRDFLRAPREPDRAVEAMRVAEHVLAVARIDERVRDAMHAAERGDAVTVEALAARARTTPRHLGRTFADVLGMAPKRALAILRLRRALALAFGPTAPSWGLVAAEAGYADQSHMGRAFRQLLGASPDAFVRAVR